MKKTILLGLCILGLPVLPALAEPAAPKVVQFVNATELCTWEMNCAEEGPVLGPVTLSTEGYVQTEAEVISLPGHQPIPNGEKLFAGFRPASQQALVAAIAKHRLNASDPAETATAKCRRRTPKKSAARRLDAEAVRSPNPAIFTVDYSGTRLADGVVEAGDPVWCNAALIRTFQKLGSDGSTQSKKLIVYRGIALVWCNNAATGYLYDQQEGKTVPGAPAEEITKTVETSSTTTNTFNISVTVNGGGGGQQQQQAVAATVLAPAPNTVGSYVSSTTITPLVGVGLFQSSGSSRFIYSPTNNNANSPSNSSTNNNSPSSSSTATSNNNPSTVVNPTNTVTVTPGVFPATKPDTPTPTTTPPAKTPTDTKPVIPGTASGSQPNPPPKPPNPDGDPKDHQLDPPSTDVQRKP